MTTSNIERGSGPSTSDAGGKNSSAERRVQIAAARLRVTLDERLGRNTPPKVKLLAKESF